MFLLVGRVKDCLSSVVLAFPFKLLSLDLKPNESERANMGALTFLSDRPNSLFTDLFCSSLSTFTLLALLFFIYCIILLFSIELLALGFKPNESERVNLGVFIFLSDTPNSLLAFAETSAFCSALISFSFVLFICCSVDLCIMK